MKLKKKRKIRVKLEKQSATKNQIEEYWKDSISKEKEARTK